MSNAPTLKPIIRQGDVLFALGQEIQLAAQAVGQLHALTERIKLYAELHPDRAAHLTAFLAGDDEPGVKSEGEPPTPEQHAESLHAVG